MKVFERFLPKIGKFYSKMLPMTYKAFPTSKVIKTCREKNMVTIFDVSQMNYVKIPKMDNTIQLLEKQFPINLEKLKPNKCELTVVLDEKCNLLDDFIITNMENHFRLIVNSESIPLFQKRLNNIPNEIIEKKIVAIQGDGSNDLLQKLKLPINQKFMENENFNDFEITRCGYTGMDGFEICGFESELNSLLEKIVDEPNVMMGGLVERDIMRLEAGFCLSGNEFGPNMKIHFNEADLDFIIKKRRRRELDFVGGENFNKKPEKMRKTFSCKKSLLNQKDIYNENGDIIGFITSSSFSFSKNYFIGMGYVNIGYEKPWFVKKNDNLVQLE